MHVSAWRSHPALRWTIALAIVAIAFAVLLRLSAPEQHVYEARSASDVAELACAYDQHRDAANRAADAYNRARIRGTGIAASRIEADATEHRAQSAQQCEERARNRADLDAQWRAAYAAENAYGMARKSRMLAIVEIGLLLLTVTVAFLAVLDARRHAERELRAYIKVELRGITENVLHMPHHPDLVIINKGQTPAHDLTFECWWEVRPWPLSENAIFKGDPPEQDLEKIVLHSGDEHPIEPFNTRDAVRHAAVETSGANPLQRMLIFGLVSYRDAFSKSRETQFCFVVRQGNLGKWEHHYCDQHNKAT